MLYFQAEEGKRKASVEAMETDSTSSSAACSTSEMDVDEKRDVYMSSCQLIKGRVTGELLVRSHLPH